MLKEAEKRIGFLVTFLSLVAFQLEEERAWLRLRLIQPKIHWLKYKNKSCLSSIDTMKLQCSKILILIKKTMKLQF